METLSALLALCAGNSPVSGELPAQRPVTRSFDVFFDLRLNKRLSKQSWGWWFETLSCPLWRHCNIMTVEYWCIQLHLKYPRFRSLQWRHLILIWHLGSLFNSLLGLRNNAHIKTLHHWCLVDCPYKMPSNAESIFHDDVIKWKHFPRCWPFVRGIHRWIPCTKASDAELWCCFLWSTPN